jgi:hypothetical protein
MQRFYFHVRSDGLLAEDSLGRDCENASAACAWAIKGMPGHLRDGLTARNTYVSTQVCDAQHRTVAVVRGTVTPEKWNGTRARSAR